MRVLPLALLLTACAADADGDGLTNAEERALGTGTRVVDSDDDGLSDGDEVLEHGTDPLLADTDGDGFDDGEEVEAGTDGTDPLAYPDTRWPDLSGRAPTDEARGWTLDGRIAAFDGVDQQGETVAIDQLWGHVVVIQLVAGTYCTGCARAAEWGQALQDDAGDRGLWTVHVLADDDTRDGDFETDFAATWAERHDLRFPVLADRAQALAVGLSDADLYDGTVPTTVLLDRQHRIVGVYAGLGDLDAIAQRADDLLDASFPE